MNYAKVDSVILAIKFIWIRFYDMWWCYGSAI